jgi:tetratricopeptide (TPR) repeat protein
MSQKSIRIVLIKLGLLVCLLSSMYPNYILANTTNSPYVDSLQNIINNTTVDTIKITNHLLISNSTRSTNTSFSSAHLDTAYKISIIKNYKKGIAEFYYQKGKMYGMLNKYPFAIKSFDSALYYFRLIDDNVKQANCYLYKGMSQTYSSQHIEAFVSYNEGIKLVDDEKDYDIYVSLLEAIANVYNTMGDLDKAIQYYKEIIELSEVKNDARMKYISIGNIGQTLAGLTKYNEGLELLLEALGYFEKTGEVYQISSIMVNIGYIYGMIGDKQKAITYYTKAIDVAKDKHNYHNELRIKKSISIVKMNQGKILEAEQDLLQLVSKFTEIEDWDLVAETYSILGELYERLDKNEQSYSYFLKAYKMSGSMQEKIKKNLIMLKLSNSYFNLGKYAESLVLLDDVILGAKNMYLLSDLASAYYIKYLCHEKLNEFKDALTYYKKYIEINDSMNILNQVNQIEKITFGFETKALEKEIEQLKSEQELKSVIINKNKRLNTLIVIIFVLTLVASLILFWIFKTRKQQELDRVSINLELKALRAQMNPHFIFNTLASIHGFILSANPTKASEYLLDFSKLMRLILENSKKQYIDLASEVDFLKLYLNLEQIRLNNTFDYEINFLNINEPEMIIIPPMIIHPFIENAVWHGMFDLKNRRGKIDININQIDNSNILVKIKDNGHGKSSKINKTSNNKLHKSYGMAITEDRLKFMRNNTMTKCINIIECEIGFEVEIIIPLEFNFESKLI